MDLAPPRIHTLLMNNQALHHEDISNENWSISLSNSIRWISRHGLCPKIRIDSGISHLTSVMPDHKRLLLGLLCSLYEEVVMRSTMLLVHRHVPCVHGKIHRGLSRQRHDSVCLLSCLPCCTVQCFSSYSLCGGISHGYAQHHRHEQRP